MRIIDQRAIPERLELADLVTADDVIDAIATLAVRGANVIGSAGALGFVLAVRAGEDAATAAQRIVAARPTAVNLRAAVERVRAAHEAGDDPLAVALQTHRRRCLAVPPDRRARSG